MKRYGNSRFKCSKHFSRQRHAEYGSAGFKCSHCKQFVVINDVMGTANRNHCNWCLWSKHVDEAKGDRQSTCMGGMEPVGLTFKHEGYGRVGEIMVVHLCLGCKKISINRVARDDPEHMILAVFTNSLRLNTAQRRYFAERGIDLLGEKDAQALRIQLFGI